MFSEGTARLRFHILMLTLLLATMLLPTSQAHATSPCSSNAVPARTGCSNNQVQALQAPNPPQAGGFIQVSGSQLTLLGQPIQLKGVNYYPQGRPWKDMWNNWDGPQVEQELRLARDQLGINAVRVLLPYSVEGLHANNGNVNRDLLQRVREMVQIAGSLNLRLIMTLFDFSEDFPPAGSKTEAQQIAYLRTLIGNFVGDDRIFAWDLHNEPDNYKLWKSGQAQSMQVMSWLERMTDVVHKIDPNHPVTVGMADYIDLLIAAPDGRRAVDYSDFISMHSYNAGDVGRQLDEIRAQTSKPIVLEEFGWPTGISCLTRSYNEDQQAKTYQDTLAAVANRAVGIFAWTLRDYDPGPAMRWDTRDEHYGLYRADSSLKPAAQVFQAYAVAPLPSVVSTNLPLTKGPSNVPGGFFAPLWFPETGHFVKGWFRQAWQLLGGRGSFGLPITEVLILPGPTPDQDRVVQYFEAGVLELHPEATAVRNYALLSPVDKTKLWIKPNDVGTAYLASRSIATNKQDISTTFIQFYNGVQGKWRLGQPISPEMVEQINGVPYTVQYFQKGRLQLDPTTHIISFGGLGRSAWDAQCQAAS